MSLANKYRPQTYEDVIGQKHIVDILKAHTSKGTQVAHTNYLLFGPRGTGKTTCARLLAKAMNCENPVDGNPCNGCESCTIITDGKSLDIVEIDAASHTGVDNIRNEIIDKASYSPSQLAMKVYIIDEVHMLSKGAFNALLKIMEEPGDKIRFILATTEIHKVIDTIISRCQVFNFKRITGSSIIERLQHICKEEKIKASDEALDLIAQMSEGCMRDAIKYLDQVSILGEVSEENVIAFLGIASSAQIEQFINDIIEAKESGSFDKLITQLEDIYAKGIDIQQLTKQVLSYIDSNLIKNIDRMSELAHVFTDIMMQTKRYPQPILLYKTKLYQYVTGESTVISPASRQGGSVAKPTPVAKAAAPAPKAPTASQPPAPATATPPSETPSRPAEPVNMANLTDLTTRFIEAIDKPTLKNIFHDQAKIQGIQGNMVDLIVINPMAKLQVKKQPTIEYLEGLLSGLLGSQHGINFIFQSKEEFVQNQLFDDL